MVSVKIKDNDLKNAAENSIDQFLQLIIQSILEAIGGEINANTLEKLNVEQATLLAWNILHEEVMDGGYVQLIYNGYGSFIFKNPFGRVMKDWGLKSLHSHIEHASKPYKKYHKTIEQERTDEDFMALFEQYPEFDDLDDAFVEMEEEVTDTICHYVDEHLEDFVSVVKDKE